MRVLSDVHIQEFHQSGKVLIPHFFSAQETQAMQLEVDRWLANGFFRNVSPDPNLQNLQCIPLNTKSPLFHALGLCPKVTQAVQALLGRPIVRILDQSFFKPARTGSATNWHTDNAYFKTSNPLSGLAMWIAIHDASITNGCLKVVPGVFEKDFAHQRDPASDHHIRTQIDDQEAFHCELDAGGVVFFCFGTPHATGDNPTDAARAGVGIHYVNIHQVDGPNADRWRGLYQAMGTTEVEHATSFQQLVEESSNTAAVASHTKSV